MKWRSGLGVLCNHRIFIKLMLCSMVPIVGLFKNKNIHKMSVAETRTLKWIIRNTRKDRI